MTIQKEEPGLWFATCDGCQARVELDTDPDDSFFDAIRDMQNLGWRVVPLTGKDRGKFDHLCGDC